MAWRELAALEQDLEIVGEIEQPQCVRNVRTRAARFHGDLGDGAAARGSAVPLQGGLEAARFLERRGVLGAVLLAHDRGGLFGAQVGADQDRYLVAPCPAGRHPDLGVAQNLIAARGALGPNHHGIDRTVAPDALDERARHPGNKSGRSGVAQVQQVDRQPLNHRPDTPLRVT